MTKVLILDIETAPIKAYVWRLWDQNIGLNQIIDNGGILCVGAKFLGDKECQLYSKWEHGTYGMLQAVNEMMNQADAVVTYHGDGFDLPRLKGEFLLYGLEPTPPITSIDILKTVKKFGFISNKLTFVGPLLKVGAKIKHSGFDLWTGVMNGDTKAQKKMSTYCKQDVNLLEKVYLKVRPFMVNHPFLSDRGACGACNGNVLIKRGYRYTKSFKIERLRCSKCGSWQDGKRTKT